MLGVIVADSLLVAEGLCGEVKLRVPEADAEKDRTSSGSTVVVGDRVMDVVLDVDREALEIELVFEVVRVGEVVFDTVLVEDADGKVEVDLDNDLEKETDFVMDLEFDGDPALNRESLPTVASGTLSNSSTVKVATFPLAAASHTASTGFWSKLGFMLP